MTKNQKLAVPAAKSGSGERFDDIIRSCGWKWIALRTFEVHGNLFALPLEKKERERLEHILRENLKQREIDDVVSLSRRGGLARRKDLAGIERGVRWKDCRQLLLQVDPQREGVLCSILAGGVLTRERLFRHGRLPGQNGNCIMPLCSRDVLETREHRYWHCVQHESLRTGKFKEIRGRLATLPQCLIQCGLATNELEEGFNVLEVQEVMLAIELKAREVLDELGHQRDDGEEIDAATRDENYKRCTGATGKSRSSGASGGGRAGGGETDDDDDALGGTKGGGRRAKKWAVPELKHPPEEIEKKGEEGRIQCKRCGRKANRGHSSQWRAFWEAECIEVPEGMKLNVAASLTARKEQGKGKVGDMAKQLKEDHAVEDFIWNGEVQSTVTCKTCGKSWPFMIMRRDRNKGVIVDKCSGVRIDIEDERGKLQNFAKSSEGKKGKHQWALAPSTAVLVCTKCGFYLCEAPVGSNASRSYACKPCGATLAKPWAGVKKQE
jgi:hypothetical protein